ncbi:helix-turn-helix domain-containing protein [Niabella hibiscisoli]|uniref:helix-turn-helix domain-containing protein n=1 Tax=Niabella hibiscisoli TaxID=1825928 RepID=UPI001F10AF6D|nr:helix-turn-helix domain-containing protein [Niabella hibiscisoli]MCH5718367.1 helix-turn-helix domain-containing protein [Niabella hibiscisoli]
MSPPILYKKLFALTGLTVNEFIKTRKLQKAAELITQGKFSLQDISDSIGYKDHKYFSKEFKNTLELLPKITKDLPTLLFNFL